MRFGEKVKLLRQTFGLSQSMLARQLGVSKRTVQSYEAGKSYPKQRQIYQQLAEIFATDINYLLMENEDISEDKATGPTPEEEKLLSPEEEAALLFASISRLFSDPSLADSKKDELMQKIQMAYWDAKKSSLL